ncbi:MAG: glycerophosphodiester phosphodiesterase [Thermoanaerobaculia bacterium]
MRLPEPPWLAAHRGALPLLENTIPALALAVEERADLLEFDVQPTLDGHLVLLHDLDLGRLAGRPDLVIQAASLAELRDLELRDPGEPVRAGRIATLADLLGALPPAFPVNIELKIGLADRQRLAGLALAATAGRESVLFSSFDAGLLRELRRQSGAAHLAPIAGRWTPALELLGDELGAWSLHVASGIGARARAGAGGVRGGPPLLVYTVNDARRARALLSAGAAGLFTDRPGPLRAELGMLGDSGVLSRTYRGTRAPRQSA